MTREEYLLYCKTCKNQKFDIKKGVICGLTDRIADFDETCNSYEVDEIKKEKLMNEDSKAVLVSRSASQGKRLANCLIDIIFFLILVFIFRVGLAIFLSIFSPYTLTILEYGNKPVKYLIIFIVWMIYFTTFEFFTGRTIGKFITKTKVVDENGDRPSFGAILTRSACRFIPFEAFSFLGDEAYGWHDKFSKTLVVDIKLRVRAI